MQVSLVVIFTYHIQILKFTPHIIILTSVRHRSLRWFDELTNLSSVHRTASSRSRKHGSAVLCEKNQKMAGIQNLAFYKLAK